MESVWNAEMPPVNGKTSHSEPSTPTQEASICDKII